MDVKRVIVTCAEISYQRFSEREEKVMIIFSQNIRHWAQI